MDPGPPELEQGCRRFLEGRGDAVAPLFRHVRSDTAARADTGAWAALIISRIFFLKGNIGLSRAYLRVASAAARHGEPPAQAGNAFTTARSGAANALGLGILVNAALILKARGRTAEAARLLRRVVDRALARGETYVAAKAASNCALCLVRGDDPRDAASYIGLAERSYTAMGCEEGLVRIEMTRALLDARLGRLDDATDGMARVLDRCGDPALTRERLIARLILAELFLGRGRLEDARGALDGAASMKDELERFGAQRLRWLCLESELNQRTGQIEEWRRFRASAETLRSRFGLSPLRGGTRDAKEGGAPAIAREAAPRIFHVPGSLRPAGALTAPALSNALNDVFWTRDPRMLELLDEIRRAASIPAPLLIQGESGVGKELIARLVHAWGGRGHEPFVPMNAAALPADLFESLAFGHAKGAFTGAVCRRQGLIEAAGRGTLFLDEIGDLALASQAKLLRLVDRGEYIPLGETGTRMSGARIVAATNRDLGAARASGLFRDDLYHRLAAIAFTIPPLRERRGDIPLLAVHALEKICARYGVGPLTLREDVLRMLSRYDWPGNVRELESLILQAALRAKGEALRMCHFPSPLIIRRAGAFPDAAGDLRSAVAGTQRARIVDALHACGGNRSRAARLLGLRRTTLLGMMKRLDLDG